MKHIDKSQFLDISLIMKKEGKMYIGCASVEDSVLKVVKKYSLLSYCYCEYCGKPARYLASINRYNKCYMCENCAKHNKLLGLTVYNRLGTGDIPVVTDCDIKKDEDNFRHTMKTRTVDIKEEYGIDFEEMWELK
jgi:hypothetical protein